MESVTHPTSHIEARRNGTTITFWKDGEESALSSGVSRLNFAFEAAAQEFMREFAAGERLS